MQSNSGYKLDIVDIDATYDEIGGSAISQLTRWMF